MCDCVIMKSDQIKVFVVLLKLYYTCIHLKRWNVDTSKAFVILILKFRKKNLHLIKGSGHSIMYNDAFFFVWVLAFNINR